MAKRPATIEAHLGESPRFKVTFRVDGVATAPTGNVTYTQVKPDGTSSSTTSGWTNPSTGVFYRDVDTDAAGLWRCKAQATVASHSAAAYGFIDVIDPLTSL